MKSIRILGEKENYKYLGILEAGTIKQEEMKEKKKENSTFEGQENISKPPKSHQRNEHLGSPSYKILGTILKIDKEGTQTNGPGNKKVDDYAQGLTSKRSYRRTVCIKKMRKWDQHHWGQRYCINKYIKKEQEKGPLTEWRHRLLRHCSRYAARRHISPIPIYHLPGLRA